MRNDDPWSSISSPPAQTSQINARRVEQSTLWGLYWAVDAHHNLLLILQHSNGIRRSRRLPKLRGLRVEAQSVGDGSTERIIIRLTDREQRDIFFRFCRDIVEATVLAKTEEQAVERFLTRAWRWHRLLQGLRNKRLGDDEQRGLIGELVVLEKHVLPVLGASAAVRCWTGPLDAPHDFEISRIHVEAKVRGSATPRVIISSEHQLDSSGADALFLHVTEVTTGAEGMAGVFTLNEMAGRIRSLMAGQDMAAVELFEERLDTAGFDWTDDYSDKLWLIGRESLYEVSEEFPRITSAMISGGVSNVRYVISLPDCETFRIALTALAGAISGAADDS